MIEYISAVAGFFCLIFAIYTYFSGVSKENSEQSIEDLLEKNKKLQQQIITLEDKLKAYAQQEEYLIEQIERLESEAELLRSSIEKSPQTSIFPATKTCLKCGKNRKRSSFYHSDKNPDGLTKWCKFCWDKENKAKKNYK